MVARTYGSLGGPCHLGRHQGVTQVADLVLQFSQTTRTADVTHARTLGDSR